MTKLILIHKINKFYHIFWEVLDYSFEPHISNFDDDFLLQVLYDIDEAIDGYDDDMTKWLYKLKLQILDCRDKVASKTAYRVWCVLSALVVGWFAYSCIEVVFKGMSDINIFTIIAKFNELM